MQQVDVIIQGAGIAGLALALMLQKSNISAIVLDHRHSLDNSGAGILLQENAILALSQLGIDVYQLEDAATISHINTGSALHPTAMRLPTSGKARAMPRTTLLRELLKPLHPSLIYSKTSIERWQQIEDKKFIVELTDKRRLQCKWLIAADGINSRLRQNLQGGKTKFRATNQYCWRMLIDEVTHNNEAYEVHAGALRFGVIPTTPQQVYFYSVNSCINEDAAKKWTWQDIKNAMQSGGTIFSSMAKFVTPSNHILFHHLVDAPVFMPENSPIILIGDAAHPMTPNLGQGAAMALEDAVILGNLLQGTSHTHNTAATFSGLRKRRIEKLHHSSFYAGAVAHWQAPWIQQAKTLGLRLLPTNLLKHQQQLFVDEFRQQLAFTKK